MKIRTIAGLLLIFAVLLGSTGITAAGDGHGSDVIPRDYDGDGISNCQDEDYTPPEDGTGYQKPNWKD